MKKFLRENKFLLVGVAAIFFLSLLFPYTGDDLQWNLTELSWDSLCALAQSPMVNGRYLGNLFVIIMTKNIYLRGILLSIILGGIVYIIKRETKVPYLLIWLLLILMPVSIWTQSIVWVSGFTNYVISTLFLLGSLLLLRKSYLSKPSWKLALGNFILILLGSFFIENVTIFFVIITSVLNVVYFIKNKKVNVSLSVAFLASILGTVLMFMQPAYHMVVTGEDTYRSFGVGVGGLISRCLANYVLWMHKFVAFKNVALITFITILLAYYYYKNQSSYSKKQRRLLNLSFYLSFSFIIYIFLARINGEWSQGLEIMMYVNTIVTSVYLIALFIQIIVLFKKKESFVKLILPLVVIIGLLAPLTIVSPIGPRNFFMVYVLEMIEAFYILKETDLDIKKFDKYMEMALVIMFVYYLSIYSYVSLINGRRDRYVQYIANETEESIVYVPKLPYQDYVHLSTYESEYMIGNYKNFLGVRRDLDFIFIEYGEWKKLVESQGYKKQ